MIPIGSLSYVSADNERVSFGSLLAKLLDASSAWRDARQERGECCAVLRCLTNSAACVGHCAPYGVANGAAALTSRLSIGECDAKAL